MNLPTYIYGYYNDKPHLIYKHHDNTMWVLILKSMVDNTDFYPTGGGLIGKMIES